MRVVVDTNVFVSAILSPKGLPAQILDLILSQKIILLVSSPIFEEYAEVLNRKEFSFSEQIIKEFLEAVGLYAARVSEGLLDHSLPDKDDEMFLACAIEGQANFLITGNKKHFPADQCRPITVVSPKEFLLKYTNA